VLLLQFCGVRHQGQSSSFRITPGFTTEFAEGPQRSRRMSEEGRRRKDDAEALSSQSWRREGAKKEEPASY
jgi:hypothetical protein